jgi:tRNA wybutosine-synthesizing protein 1
MQKIPEKFKKIYYKQGYRIVGKNQHSAVKICRWTRESLRHGRVCFKQKWYGIESHRCLQCTPALFWCTHACQFCWRSTSATIGTDMKNFPIDEPSEIIDELIEAQRLLLTGFKGNEKVDKKKWKEAQNPTNMAISLAGEPTLYERLSDLIEEAHKRRMSTFLVTNGTRPDRLKKLEVEPTNLYISLCAPDEETYKKTNQPLIKDGWKKLNESLELMKDFSCRKVIRLTLVKGLNMKDPEKYAKLILKTETDFIEAKGYMWVGESQNRLSKESMPFHEDIVDFAEKLSEFTGYEIKDEFKPSRVILLTKN